MCNGWSRRNVLKAAGALALVPILPRGVRAELPELSGPTMGTRYSVRVHRAPVGLYLPKLRRAIERALQSTEDLMSTYRADSELSRFNASRSSRWQKISQPVARVVQMALRIQTESGGAFDPAAAPLVDYWGFGPGPGTFGRPARPLPEDLLTRVTDANIALEAGHLRKQHPDAALDLNAIAKGDALDQVAGVLERAGIDDYLVEVGGELRARGNGPDGDGWRIAIDGPEGNIRRAIRLNGKAVATSGDYVDYFIADGKRYAHIIDPRTGKPVEHGLSLVSVVADSAMHADAWATALLVMGPEKGPRQATRNGMAALFLVRNDDEFREFATPAFERLRLDNEETQS
jgi:thiamine biosynthesis lipoprotein